MNPLASARATPPAAEPHPLQRHAELWKHVNAHPPEALQAHVQFADYALPILGKLAGDPKVNAKEVIKAVSSAVADGKMDPSKAVAVISQMPADDDKLKPWLRERYADMLGITVHAKAALLQQAEQQAAPVQPGMQQSGMQQPGVQQPGTPAQPMQPGAAP